MADLGELIIRIKAEGVQESEDRLRRLTEQAARLETVVPKMGRIFDSTGRVISQFALEASKVVSATQAMPVPMQTTALATEYLDKAMAKLNLSAGAVPPTMQKIVSQSTPTTVSMQTVAAATSALTKAFNNMQIARPAPTLQAMQQAAATTSPALTSLTTAAQSTGAAIAGVGQAAQGQSQGLAVAASAAGNAQGVFGKLGASVSSFFNSLKAGQPALQGATAGLNASGQAAKFGVGQFVAHQNATRRLSNSMFGLRDATASIFTIFLAIRAFRDSIRTIVELETALTSLRAIAIDTGASFAEQSAQFKRLSDSVHEIGRTTVFSARQAAEGLLVLARAGLTADEALQALRPTLALAQGQLISFEQAAELTVNILRQFGLSVVQTTTVVDTLTVTANKTTTTVEQLGESMKFVGPVAASIGKSLQETSAALGVLSNQGIRGALAGTSLRGVLSALVAPTRAAREQLRAYGISLQEVSPITNSMADVFRRLRDAALSPAAVLDIFSRRNLAAAVSLIENADAVETLETSIKSLAGETDRFQKLQENTIAGAYKSTIAAFQEIVSSSTLATSGLRNFIITIRDAARLLLGVNDPISKANAAAVALVASLKIVAKTIIDVATILSIVFVLNAIGKAVIALNLLRLGLSAATVSMGLFKTAALAADTALTGLAAVFARNPLGIAVGAVAALTFAIFKLRGESKATTESLTEMSEALDTVFVDQAVNRVKELSTELEKLKKNAPSIDLFAASTLDAELPVNQVQQTLAQLRQVDNTAATEFEVRVKAGVSNTEALVKNLNEQSAAIEEISTQLSNLLSRIQASLKDQAGLVEKAGEAVFITMARVSTDFFREDVNKAASEAFDKVGKLLDSGKSMDSAEIVREIDALVEALRSLSGLSGESKADVDAFIEAATKFQTLRFDVPRREFDKFEKLFESIGAQDVLLDIKVKFKQDLAARIGQDFEKVVNAAVVNSFDVGAESTPISDKVINSIFSPLLSQIELPPEALTKLRDAAAQLAKVKSEIAEVTSLRDASLISEDDATADLDRLNQRYKIGLAKIIETVRDAGVLQAVPAKNLISGLEESLKDLERQGASTKERLASLNQILERLKEPALPEDVSKKREEAASSLFDEFKKGARDIAVLEEVTENALASTDRQSKAFKAEEKALKETLAVAELYKDATGDRVTSGQRFIEQLEKSGVSAREFADALGLTATPVEDLAGAFGDIMADADEFNKRLSQSPTLLKLLANGILNVIRRTDELTEARAKADAQDSADAQDIRRLVELEKAVRNENDRLEDQIALKTAVTQADRERAIVRKADRELDQREAEKELRTREEIKASIRALFLEEARLQGLLEGTKRSRELDDELRNLKEEIKLLGKVGSARVDLGDALRINALAQSEINSLTTDGIEQQRDLEDIERRRSRALALTARLRENERRREVAGLKQTIDLLGKTPLQKTVAIEVKRLEDAGVDPARIKAAADGIRGLKKVADSVNLGESLFGPIESSLDGLIRGTQTLRGLLEDTFVSFVSQFARQNILDPIKDQFLGFIEGFEKKRQGLDKTSDTLDIGEGLASSAVGLGAAGAVLRQAATTLEGVPGPLGVAAASLLAAAQALERATAFGSAQSALQTGLGAAGAAAGGGGDAGGAERGSRVDSAVGNAFERSQVIRFAQGGAWGGAGHSSLTQTTINNVTSQAALSQFSAGDTFNDSVANAIRVSPENRFARGNPFLNKVVNSPTTAPLALFGEAGPEAIVPLRRTQSGLGVSAYSGNGREVSSAPLRRGGDGRLGIDLDKLIDKLVPQRSKTAAVAVRSRAFADGDTFNTTGSEVLVNNDTRMFATGGVFTATTAGNVLSVGGSQAFAAGDVFNNTSSNRSVKAINAFAAGDVFNTITRVTNNDSAVRAFAAGDVFNTATRNTHNAIVTHAYAAGNVFGSHTSITDARNAATMHAFAAGDVFNTSRFDTRGESVAHVFAAGDVFNSSASRATNALVQATSSYAKGDTFDYSGASQLTQSVHHFAAGDVFNARPSTDRQRQGTQPFGTEASLENVVGNAGTTITSAVQSENDNSTRQTNIEFKPTYIIHGSPDDAFKKTRRQFEDQMRDRLRRTGDT